jgi:hypothetical protein
MAKIRINGYVHSSKESMADLGEEHGLTGKALDKFCYALYEVMIPMMVDTETGEYEIIKDEITA